MQEYFVGTEIKLAINIECEGFNIDRDPWTAIVRQGCRSVRCNRTTNAVRDTDGAWYLLIDTKQLGGGSYELVVDIDIPDTDFPDGYRHETHKLKLFNVGES